MVVLFIMICCSSKRLSSWCLKRRGLVFDVGEMQKLYECYVSREWPYS